MKEFVYKEGWGKETKLTMADKVYNNAVAKLAETVGKKSCSRLFTLDYIIKEVLKLYKEKNLWCKGQYTINLLSDNSGYAKSCSWRKEVVSARITINTKKITEIKLDRIKLNGGEYIGDNVRTANEKTRLHHLLDFCGKQSHLIQYGQNPEIENNFIAAMMDFEV